LKKAYIVYPGLGKTTLSNQNEKFSDIETKIFKDLSLSKYIGRKDYPNYRGQQINEFNPEYPNNRNEFAQKQLALGRTILLVPKQDSYDLLEVLGINDYCFIMPDKDKLKQLEQDYIARGDDLKYIKRNITERYEQVLEFAQQMEKEVIFIKSNEYLMDILIPLL